MNEYVEVQAVDFSCGLHFEPGSSVRGSPVKIADRSETERCTIRSIHFRAKSIVALCSLFFHGTDARTQRKRTGISDIWTDVIFKRAIWIPFKFGNVLLDWIKFWEFVKFPDFLWLSFHFRQSWYRIFVYGDDQKPGIGPKK